MTRDRELLRRARLMLLFTPELCAGDPRATLASAAPEVDVVQVRVKQGARATLEAARLALEVLGPDGPPVLVNDRLDVAIALASEGVVGAHVGHLDCPPVEARNQLGPDAWLGLSTHSVREVAEAQTLPVDYLGFGPVHATATKGYENGLGPESAWVADAGSALPLYPIGGIDETNADALATVGRAAVSGAILGAPDPAAAARRIRDLLRP